MVAPTVEHWTDRLGDHGFNARSGLRHAKVLNSPLFS